MHLTNQNGCVYNINMVTLRDLLKDFANDILALAEGNSNLGNLGHSIKCTCEICINEVADEYLEKVKNRLIG